MPVSKGDRALELPLSSSSFQLKKSRKCKLHHRGAALSQLGFSQHLVDRHTPAKHLL